MSLQVELKPGERVFIGDSLVTNAQERIRLYVDGDAPVLRERDVLSFEAANSPAKRIYVAVQLMYFVRSTDQARRDYLNLVSEFIEACPSATPYIARISYYVFLGNIYKALKETRLLIAYEDELLNGTHARQ